MSFSLSDIINAGTQLGLAATQVSSLVSSLVGSSIASKAKPYLEQIAASASSTAAINSLANELEALPGLPPSVIPLIDSLRAPGVTPMQILQAVTLIETELANA